MQNYYSGSDIKQLRRTKVRLLIHDVLKIPYQTIKYHPFYQCPLCHQYTMGIHPHKNLAYCPPCDKRFNAIDIVQSHKDIPFKQAADFLDNLQLQQP